MGTVIDNTPLATQLQTIRKVTEQFMKENSEKSAEQLIAEIDFVKSLLDQTKNYLVKKNNIIL
jgi:hypothetical protein